MKRKIGSVLLALVLTLVLLPTAALADNGTPKEATVENDFHEAKSIQTQYVKLMNNIALNGTLEVDWNLTLDLNGYTLSKGEFLSSDSILEVTETLTLIDSSDGKTGAIDGAVVNRGKIMGGIFNTVVRNESGSSFSGDIYKDDQNVYHIYTAEGLKWFRNLVNSVKDKKDSNIWAVLENDIELDVAENWEPIGLGDAYYNNQPPFAGTFDGNGHTIKNLNVDSDALYVGLFGYVYGGTIRNLTVSGSVTGKGKGTTKSHTGGIAGGANGGTFENCANLCDVSGATTGGIIGYAPNDSNDLIVRDCYNAGNITSTTGNSVGGIIGQCTGLLPSTISNCYNAGKVTGSGGVGAIVGNGGTRTISNCYYLDGSAIRQGTGDKKSTPKSETEFADGTVLKLLQEGERGSNADPWDSKCRFVTEADKYLPVFKYQDSYEPAPEAASSGSRFSYSTISAIAGENGKISPSGNLSVRDDLSQTFVFTPDKGYRVKDVLIDGQSVGALRSYTFATVRKNRTVEVIFEKIPAFVDVPASSYYEEAVNWAVENWITEGTDDTHFSPDAPCTRAQAVTFLWRAAGCPAPASYTMPFADVKSGSYYETAVLWALENNIVSGTSETTFEPDAVCTRAQIVCFLFRYKAANGMDAVTLAELLGGYTDSAEIPAYASPALNWALAASVLQGSGSKLLPNNPCTRAQIVTFLYRTIR